MQLDHLVEDLPGYRANIRIKIADVRLAGKGGAVEKLQEMFAGIKTDLETSEAPTGTVLRPLVVASDQVDRVLGLRVARARPWAAKYRAAATPSVLGPREPLRVLGYAVMGPPLRWR